jgi:GNAT superfamily N-acetyltransferase
MYLEGARRELGDLVARGHPPLHRIGRDGPSKDDGVHGTGSRAPGNVRYYPDVMAVVYQWRGVFTNMEMNALHAEAFETRVDRESEWNWQEQLNGHSLGWVTARDEADGSLVGFVNVPWDGLVHAWIQDTMVAQRARHRGIGKRVIEIALDEARQAGCEWMHVDFEDHLRSFYFDACGFKATNAGLISL